MSSKWKLATGGKDANATGIRYQVGWKDEHGLRVIELTRDGEHLAVAETACVWNYRERIAPV
jgi:hypothetical protein